MIVVTKNAEEKLLQELQGYREVSTTLRCFYMGFSKTDLPRRALFENFLRLLDEIPNSYMAQVYICHDQDVFILMAGFMQRHFQDFLSKLAGTMGSEKLAGLAEVFEVGVHWPDLEMLCRKKIESLSRIEAVQMEKLHLEEGEEIAAQALAQLDAEHVASIGLRRERGKDIVVMVVDDDQISRTLVGNVIDKSFRYTYAKDGKSAISEFVDCAPDVVFLDIGLPDISGHAVLETLFQIDPQAYVIMLSGRKDKDNMMMALNAGAQGFIGKPFTREKINTHIDQSPHVRKKQSGMRKSVHAAV